MLCLKDDVPYQPSKKTPKVKCKTKNKVKYKTKKNKNKKRLQRGQSLPENILSIIPSGVEKKYLLDNNRIVKKGDI